MGGSFLLLLVTAGMTATGLEKQITAGIKLGAAIKMSKWVIFISEKGSSFCLPHILCVLMCSTPVHQEYKGIILANFPILTPVIWYPKKSIIMERLTEAKCDTADSLLPKKDVIHQIFFRPLSAPSNYTISPPLYRFSTPSWFSISHGSHLTDQIMVVFGNAIIKSDQSLVTQ